MHRQHSDGDGPLLARGVDLDAEAGALGAGGGVDRLARARSHVAARAVQRPSPPPTLTPSIVRSGGGQLVAARRRRSRRGRRTAAARAARRRARSGSTSRPGSASRAAWTTSWRGRNVCTSSRPPCSAAAGQPGAAYEQRHRLLGGPVARRQQLGVDVEEGDDVGARRRGAARLRCRRRCPAAGRRLVVAPVTATTGRPAAASSSSRSRVTPGRRLANADAPHCRHTGGRTVPQRRHAQRAVVGEPDGGVADRAAGQRPARPAGQDPGPARRVVHAHDACGRVAQVGDQRRRHERRLPRLVAAAVDQLDDRPAGPLLVDRRAHQPVADGGQAVDGRARRHQQHRHAGPPSPLDSDVAGVPRRAALLLQRLVVLVDDDDRGDVRGTAPTPPPGRRSRRRRRRPPPPTPAGMHATVSPARRSRVATQPGLVDRRHDDQHRPAGDGGQHAPARRRRPAGAAASRHRRRAARRRPSWPGSATQPGAARAGGSPATLVGGLAVTRNGRSRAAAQRTAAHRRQLDSSGAGPRDDTAASGRSRATSTRRRRDRAAITQPATRRPCSGTRTRVPTRQRRAPRGRGSRTPCRAR